METKALPPHRAQILADLRADAAALRNRVATARANNETRCRPPWGDARMYSLAELESMADGFEADAANCEREWAAE